MSSVDDRIVNMQFNNKQFVSGATESQKALEGLDRTLANTGNSKGLTTMAGQVDQVRTRFGALQVAGVAALATIASKATTMGLGLIKSLTIDPISQGFAEYETNLKSVQTIMANTGESTKTVGKYLTQLNEYSDKTIYNFSQMADSIGKFTAAGVKLPAATSAIKGMANVAALTGANTNQLNSAMYQMSQALASGTIKLMDWNSLVNANMGTENMQEALKATAQTIEGSGEAMDAAIKKHGTFRDSLTEGWLSADIFTKTMKVMAGTTNEAGETVAYTVKQLKDMGYADKAAKDLNRLSAASIDSATKIKTFTQMIDVIKESVGSGFAKVFEGLFGNLKEASTLWTTVGNTITDAIGGIFDSVNAVLTSWKQLGGFTALWAGFGNIFKTIGNLLAPFVIAFQTILPTSGKAGEGLANLSKGFESVTAGMEKASRGAMVITPYLVMVAKGIKAAFGGIGAAIGYVKDLVGSLDNLKSAFKNLSLDDFSFDNLMNLGSKAVDLGKNIIAGIAEGLGVSVSELTSAMSEVANTVIDTFKDILGIHSPAQAMIPLGEAIIQGIIQGVVAAASLIWDAIMGLSSIIVGAFSDLFGDMDALDWATFLNTLLTGGMILAVTNMTNNFGGIAKSLNGMKEVVTDTFGAVTDTLGAMQTKLKAEALKAIAIAIGILAASLLVISFIKVPALEKSLTAIGIMLAMLVGSLFALSKISTEVNLAALAASLLLISMAMLNLAVAVAILGRQDYETLKKGLGSIAIVLGTLVVAMFAFSKIKGSIAGMAGSIFVIALAMNALAAAVLAFGSMDVETLKQGLGGLAITLGLVVLAMLGLDQMKGKTEGVAATILVMSGAMMLLAKAIQMMGSMSLGDLAKGLVGLGVGLAFMVATILVLAGIGPAAVVAAAAVLIMGEAVVLMAIGLKILADVLTMLAALDWDTYLKGLAMLTLLAIPILAVGAAALAVAPGLIVLGISMGLIGAAMFLAGAGMLAFATGFALLVTVGTAGIGLIVFAFQAFMALLPTFAIQFAAAMVGFVEAIAAAAPRMREAMSKIFAEMIGVVQDAIPRIGELIETLFDTILEIAIETIPKYGKLISTLLETGLKVIRKFIPQMVTGGVDILIALLRGFEQRIPLLADAAVDAITAFINAIAEQGPKLADSAAKAIIRFINGLTTAIENNDSELRTAGLNLAYAIVNGMTGGLLGWGMDQVRAAATALADALPGWMRKVLGVESPSKVTAKIGEQTAEGLAVGMDDSHSIVEKSATSLGATLAKAMALGIQDEAKIAVTAAVQMVNAVIAEGDEAILALQQKASAKQYDAYRVQARANMGQKTADKFQGRADDTSKRSTKASNEAEKLRRLSERNEALAKKAEGDRAKHLLALSRQQDKHARQLDGVAKRSEKAAEKQQKAADRQQKAADKQQKAADKAQRAADKAAQRVTDAKNFNAADLEGKGDIWMGQAFDATTKAQQYLAEAEAKQERADRLLDNKKKKDDKRGERLQDEADKAAEAAERYATAATTARSEAERFYHMAKMEEAKAVYARIEEIEGSRRAEEEAAKADAEFAAADTEGKIKIMEARAKASEARAAAARKAAEAAMQEAKNLAMVDADAAMAQLDLAEEQASRATAAADQAKQERDQAAQLLEQAKSQTASGGAGSSLSPSRGVLEDAARVVDRYSASLAEAEALAASAQPVVQFSQTNTSPIALTASEIYRQTKNLLSATEIKMGAN
jgi:tape measure domain-containing protein